MGLPGEESPAQFLGALVWFGFGFSFLTLAEFLLLLCTETSTVLLGPVGWPVLYPLPSPAWTQDVASQ